MWHINHLVMWQLKGVISPPSEALWIPNLVGYWFLYGYYDRGLCRKKLADPSTSLCSGVIWTKCYIIFSLIFVAWLKLYLVISCHSWSDMHLNHTSFVLWLFSSLNKNNTVAWEKCDSMEWLFKYNFCLSNLKLHWIIF